MIFFSSTRHHLNFNIYFFKIDTKLRSIPNLKKKLYKYSIDTFDCTINLLYNSTQNCLVFSTILFREILEFKTDIIGNFNNQTIGYVNLNDVISFLDRNPLIDLDKVVFESNGLMGNI
jgi:hypothetical protein